MTTKNTVKNSFMQAIATKYLGPTNSRGSRVKATAGAGSVTIEWAHNLNADQNHDAACLALANKMGWQGDWIGGGTETGYLYVNSSFLN